MWLEKIHSLSGEKASIYTITLKKGHDNTLLDKFILKLRTNYLQELIDVMRRIKSLSQKLGIVEPFYRSDEGLKIGDNVVALNDDPDGKLRLYGIRINEKLIILGSGGPKNTRTWQQDTLLKNEVEFMMLISEMIQKKMERGELWLTTDKKDFGGDLQLP